MTPQPPPLGHTRPGQQFADIHRRAFRHDSIPPTDSLPSFALHPALPDSAVARDCHDYYDGSAPLQTQTVDGETCPRPAGCRTGGRTWDGSRVHLLPINGCGAQLYPGGPHGYAAPLPRRPPARAAFASGPGAAVTTLATTRTTPSPTPVPDTPAAVDSCTDPDPPGFESAPPNEASNTGF